MRPGEGLTAEPVAYAGVVYFPTWTPASDRCSGGAGRLYGLRFDDCSPGLDTDGDGDADSADSAAISTGTAYPSGITVTDAGTILYGTSAVATDGTHLLSEPSLQPPIPFWEHAIADGSLLRGHLYPLRSPPSLVTAFNWPYRAQLLLGGTV